MVKIKILTKDGEVIEGYANTVILDSKSLTFLVKVDYEEDIKYNIKDYKAISLESEKDFF